MLTFVLFSECQMALAIVCFSHPDLQPRRTHTYGIKPMNMAEYDIRMCSTNLRGPFLQPDPGLDRIPNGSAASKSCKYISYQLNNKAWQSLGHLVRRVFKARTLISLSMANKINHFMYRWTYYLYMLWYERKNQEMYFRQITRMY